MANVIIDNTNLTNIANAIRNKNRTETTYKPSEMAAAINDLNGGLIQENSAANMDIYLQTRPANSVYEFTGSSTSTYKTGRLYVIVDWDYPVQEGTVLSARQFFDISQSGNLLELE